MTCSIWGRILWCQVHHGPCPWCHTMMTGLCGKVGDVASGTKLKLFQEHILVFSVSRITPSQMSARSYRRPRNSKTRSNLIARGPGLEEQPCALCTLGHKGGSEKASLRASCSLGQLQVFPTWFPRSRLILLEPTVLCASQCCALPLPCTSALGPSTQTAM